MNYDTRLDVTIESEHGNGNTSISRMNEGGGVTYENDLSICLLITDRADANG